MRQLCQLGLKIDSVIAKTHRQRYPEWDDNAPAKTVLFFQYLLNLLGLLPRAFRYRYPSVVSNKIQNNQIIHS